jgi:hypothetical protein
MTPGDAAQAMGEQQLAPGVHGWYFDTPEGIYIPVITADNPGSGEVGKYLDSLPCNRDIKFSTVLSAKLRGMLLRRGFVDATEFSEEWAEKVEIMVRRATANA